VNSIVDEATAFFKYHLAETRGLMRVKIFIFFTITSVFILSACLPNSVASISEAEIAVASPIPTSVTLQHTNAELQLHNSDQDNTSCASHELLCIGFIAFHTGIDNQTTWDGVKRAKADLLAQVDYIEISDLDEIDSSIQFFAEQNYDLIVTTGSYMQESTLQAAKKYSKPHFIGVEQEFATSPDNLTGIIFPRRKLGYLAGSLAAEMTKTNTVGIVLAGESLSGMVELREGFEAGVYATSHNIKVLSTYHLAQDQKSLNDLNWGAQSAESMLTEGADVIFANDTPISHAALNEAAKSRTTYCIGMGAGQWELLPKAQSCLITSVTKQIEDSVFELIAKIAISDTQDHFGHPSGNFNGNFNGRVGIVQYDKFNTIISAETKATLNGIVKQLNTDSDDLLQHGG
jgi:basic membrane protein A